MNCTGSLISSRVFVTAAHCGRHGTRRSVAFDEVFNPEIGSVYRDVLRPSRVRAAHEFKNDVAVIVFDEPVPDVDAARLRCRPSGSSTA